MSESSTPDEEPKLVVDTDWKEQVAKEKEQLAAEDKSQAETIDDVADFVAKKPDSSPRGESDELPPPPPASFEVLVSLLFTQAMGTLGHIPNPATGESEVNKSYAKHYIDTLEMLGEKTKGNLKDDESKMLSEALHALRMAYVNAKE